MKVVVCGGGVIGLAVAWRCGEAGIRVTVVDPAPGTGASWVAGGMLAPVAEAHPGEEAVVRLGLASNARFGAFVAALRECAGTDPGYTRNGTLVVARHADDSAELARLHELHARWGLASERLVGRDARRREPALGPHVCGALWIEDDHQVDNRRFVTALLGACRAVGVQFVAETATAITATAVTVTDGTTTLDADAVVVATGASVPPIRVDGAPVSLPVRPVKGQILRLQGTPAAVAPTRTVRGTDVYVIPRADGEIAIGATSEERGTDRSVTAGAVHELLRAAGELLPGLAEARFVEAAAGLRPGTPDNAPLLGRLGGGPVVATGHYRNGILLAPVTADVVVELLRDGTTPELARPFRPDRFSAVRA